MALLVIGGSLVLAALAHKKKKKRDEEFWREAAQPTAQEKRRIEILSMLTSQTYMSGRKWDVLAKSWVLSGSLREGAQALQRYLSGSHPGVEKQTEYWTRMEYGSKEDNNYVSEEDEGKLRIAHFLRRDDHPDPGVAPKLIITCRGTIISSQDIADDVRSGFHILHTSPQYLETEKLIEKLIKHFRETYGGDNPSDIWLAGHSLGADILLLVAMKLAAKHIKVSLCCFNGPLVTVLSLASSVFQIKRMSNILWNVKEMLDETSKIFEVCTDAVVKFIDSTKLRFAYLLNPKELESQLAQFRSLEMGPVWMCMNENDFICKEFINFYRRNDKKTRLRVSNQALLSTCALVEDTLYFRRPSSVTMFLTRDSSNAHGHDQWFSPYIQMRKKDCVIYKD